MLPLTELIPLAIIVVLIVSVYGFVKTLPKRKRADDE